MAGLEAAEPLSPGAAREGRLGTWWPRGEARGGSSGGAAWVAGRWRQRQVSPRRGGGGRGRGELRDPAERGGRDWRSRLEVPGPPAAGPLPPTPRSGPDPARAGPTSRRPGPSAGACGRLRRCWRPRARTLERSVPRARRGAGGCSLGAVERRRRAGSGPGRTACAGRVRGACGGPWEGGGPGRRRGAAGHGARAGRSEAQLLHLLFQNAAPRFVRPVWQLLVTSSSLHREGDGRRQKLAASVENPVGCCLPLRFSIFARRGYF